MSIASENRRNDYVGNGSVSSYNYGFKIFNADELDVVVRDPVTNAETPLTYPTDYSVSGVGQSSGGAIALVNNGQAWLTGANLTTGKLLTILGARPAIQDTDIRNQGSYLPETVEDSFDKGVVAIQQLKEKLARAVILPKTVTASTFDPELPSQNGVAAAVPGAPLVVNATGNGFTFAASSQGWKTVDLSSAAFLAAGTTSQIKAFTLPKGCILIGVAIKHLTAFAGGVISAVTMDIGTVASPQLFLSSFNVFQAVADTAFANASVNNIQSFGSDTDIQIRAVSSGANLSSLTQGVVRVYYWYMSLGS